jgi:outer membrane protein TolC
VLNRCKVVLFFLIFFSGFKYSAAPLDDVHKAIANPEYLLDHWVKLPTSPINTAKKAQSLSLREAILLALRYNPNIQNAELDRIIQRYQLRLAYNAFELQYALAGSAAIENSQFQGAGSTSNHNFLATPELALKTKLGTSLSLGMSNNISSFDSYAPVLNFTVTQPLLRGFGQTVNEVSLLNAQDQEFLSKINLQQSVVDKITGVISAYRALILSGNNLKNQQLQLKEAKETYENNKKKIKAGQLERTANVQQSYQIESLSLMVEQGANNFKIARQDLLQAIGLDPETNILVPSDVELKNMQIPDLQSSIDLALTNNTQYLAQKMALQAQKRAYEVAKNNQLWQLDATGQILSGVATDVDDKGGGGIGGIFNGQNIRKSANIRLTIPIHDINRRSELINAKVALEKERINLLTLERALITKITNTINTTESQGKRYRLAKKQVSLAERSYALEKKKQEAGISSALDVNNTQNQLIQAQAGLISAKIDYLNQISELQRLLGTTLKEWQINLRYGQ